MELTPIQFAEVRESLAALETKTGSSDKRRFTRLKVQGKVTLTDAATSQSHTAMTRDLSLNGMGVVQSIPARNGQELTATLPRSENNSVQIYCTVVEARPLAEGLYALHMQFEGMLNPQPTGANE
jgi:hypothetical protein